jgi:hypothetical protein
MVSDFHLSDDEYQFSQTLDKQHEIVVRKQKCKEQLN